MGDSFYNLSFLTINDIEEVKVFRPGPDAAQFPFAPDGVIQFITKKGYEPGANVKSKSMEILPPSYPTARNYDEVENSPELEDQFKQSIFWESYAINSDDRRTSIEFRRTEEPYEVVVDYVSKNGRVVSKVVKFE